MDVKIRNARPDDASFIAWLILTSGRAHVTRGIWEVIINEAEDRVLSFLELLAVSEVPHLFHHSCFIIAEADRIPVSGLGGYDPVVLGYHALLSVVPEVYQKLGMGIPADMTRGALPRITSCIPPAPEAAWVIDSVATLPAFRRRGIVDALLDRMLETGREKGYHRAGLSIYIGNIAAQRAYEKHGFTLLDEWRDAYFEREIGSPGMARMICDLV